MKDYSIAKTEQLHIEKLKTNLKKSDEERYFAATKMLKIGIMLKNAKVTHHINNIKKIK
jgi:hypothetical protein